MAAPRMVLLRLLPNGLKVRTQVMFSNLAISDPQTSLRFLQGYVWGINDDGEIESERHRG